MDIDHKCATVVCSKLFLCYILTQLKNLYVINAHNIEDNNILYKFAF